MGGVWGSRVASMPFALDGDYRPEAGCGRDQPGFSNCSVQMVLPYGV